MNVAYERGNDNVQNFIEDLALFLTTYFLKHRSILERPDQSMLLEGLMAGHQYLANISTVDDIEVFKIALEYWFSLTEALYHEVPPVVRTSGRLILLPARDCPSQLVVA